MPTSFCSFFFFFGTWSVLITIVNNLKKKFKVLGKKKCQQQLVEIFYEILREIYILVHATLYIILSHELIQWLKVKTKYKPVNLLLKCIKFLNNLIENQI